ncbi:hypothetical protein J5X98_23630 [Leptothermofonsia sichuanensis E412]|nr:hypothetical protein [Leptothermofonsia sichuanensis]QZZ23819.1 hypothetical protein J5X98_23630 [Leptothermofonsia sichuanensis E412]
MSVTLSVVSKDKAIHLGVDSTGVKVYGEGEWKIRQHGVSQQSRGSIHQRMVEATDFP